MKIKTKVKWGTLGVLVGYTGCIGVIGYKIGYIEGQKDAQEERRCTQLITKVREEFIKNCEANTYQTFQNGGLDQVIRKRQQLAELNDCETLEEWKCEPTIPSNIPKSEFRAKFYTP